MNTLLLDQSEWDLVLDASGNIAVAAEPYAVAQDVASAVRVFAGELWYDTSQGVPYPSDVLGETPSLQYLKSKIEAAALTVPKVVKARCLFASLDGRVLTGQIQVIDVDGVENNVSF
jgi:hypothetical protein